jgi:hypothetical protein
MKRPALLFKLPIPKTKALAQHNNGLHLPVSRTRKQEFLSLPEKI